MDRPLGSATLPIRRTPPAGRTPSRSTMFAPMRRRRCSLWAERSRSSTIRTTPRLLPVSPRLMRSGFRADLAAESLLPSPESMGKRCRAPNPTLTYLVTSLQNYGNPLIPITVVSFVETLFKFTAGMCIRPGLRSAHGSGAGQPDYYRRPSASPRDRSDRPSRWMKSPRRSRESPVWSL